MKLLRNFRSSALLRDATNATKGFIMNFVPKNFQIPVDLAEKLRAHAFHLRYSQTKIVSIALREYFARQEKQVARDAHLQEEFEIESNKLGN